MAIWASRRAGFRPRMQQKVLKGATPVTTRPGAGMAPVDLEATAPSPVEGA
jgi:pyruvate carboxylase